MSKKHKKTCKTINFFEHSLFLFLLLLVTFTTLFGSSLGITITAVGLKLYEITAGIKSISQLSIEKREIIKDNRCYRSRGF